MRGTKVSIWTISEIFETHSNALTESRALLGRSFHSLLVQDLLS